MNERETLFDALDLPPELHDLQDGYWKARREWEALDCAYGLVLSDLLAPSSKGRTPVFEAEDCGSIPRGAVKEAAVAVAKAFSLAVVAVSRDDAKVHGISPRREDNPDALTEDD